MKRLNPKTGEVFKMRDLREDGFIFIGYQKTRKIKKTGYFPETWISPAAFEKSKIASKKFLYEKSSTKDGHVSTLWYNAKARAQKQNVPFEITLKYLQSIAPEKCPVFGHVLLWGSHTGKGPKFNSPSLDKIKPELGYIEGNVQFLSHQANIMKQDASPEQLRMFGEWAIKQ